MPFSSHQTIHDADANSQVFLRTAFTWGAAGSFPEIAEELAELLAECPLDVGRCRGELASERFGDQYAHALVVGRTLSAHGRLGAHW